MTARIFRYEVPVDDQPHTIALFANPLAVGCRDPRVVEFWAIAHDGLSVLDRTFLVVGTGYPLPEGGTQYWGTAVAPGGQLVWHLMELTP